MASVRHLERIREEVTRAGADALWVHPSVNFAYLTGLRPIALERPAALVILADGGLRALAPQMLALEIVCAAHDAVIAGLEPGMPCADADRLARGVIEAAGYGERFVHRTGHGVGLELHEEPYLRAGSDERL